MSDIIAIRHGKTEYTEECLDLTAEGIEETRQLAIGLRERINQYDELIVVTSPLARTKGTAKIFLEEIGRDCCPRISNAIRCVDVFDLEKFTSFSNENSTNVYGEMWFNNPELEEDSPMAEGRRHVNNRAGSFLRHIASFLYNKSLKEGKKIGLIVFTHFEIASNYLRPIYGEVPTMDAPGIKNSEAIFISVDSGNPRLITISCRGLEAKAMIVSNQLFRVDES